MLAIVLLYAAGSLFFVLFVVVVGCHSLHLPRAQEVCAHPLAKDVKVSSICHDMMKMEGDCMSLASHPLFLEAFLEANSYPYCRYSTACNGWSGYQTCLHGKSLVRDYVTSC